MVSVGRDFRRELLPAVFQHGEEANFVSRRRDDPEEFSGNGSFAERLAAVSDWKRHDDLGIDDFPADFEMFFHGMSSSSWLMMVAMIAADADHIAMMTAAWR